MPFEPRSRWVASRCKSGRTISGPRPTEARTPSIRHIRHGVGAAHNKRVEAERDLRVGTPQPLRDHVQQNPGGGQPVPGGTVAETVSSRHQAFGAGRLLVEGGMLNDDPQATRRRLPCQSDNGIAGPVVGGPVAEQAVQVVMQRHDPALTSTSRDSSTTVSPARHMISATTRVSAAARASLEHVGITPGATGQRGRTK